MSGVNRSNSPNNLTRAPQKKTKLPKIISSLNPPVKPNILDSLSDELIQKIGTLCKVYTLGNFIQTCSKYNTIINNNPIRIFNNGKMIRDFTYIDDIIESLFRLLSKPVIPNRNFDTNLPDPSSSWAAHRIFNIGNSSPTPLMDYVKAIEDYLGIVAKKEFLPMQKGDVRATSADTSSLEEWIGFKPNTSIKKGVSQFLDWYKNFYEKQIIN